MIRKQQEVFGITTEMNQKGGVGGANSNINYSIKDSKSFEYKASITENQKVKTQKKKVEIVVPLKHLSNFWRTLDMPLINCEINLILTWFENFLLTSKATRDEQEQ